MSQTTPQSRMEYLAHSTMRLIKERAIISRENHERTASDYARLLEINNTIQNNRMVARELYDKIQEENK